VRSGLLVLLANSVVLIALLSFDFDPFRVAVFRPYPLGVLRGGRPLGGGGHADGPIAGVDGRPVAGGLAGLQRLGSLLQAWPALRLRDHLQAPAPGGGLPCSRR